MRPAWNPEPYIAGLMKFTERTCNQVLTAWRWLQGQCAEASQPRIWAVCGGILLLCSALIFFNMHDDADINTLLDVRDQAISERDISAYAGLIAEDYLDGKRNRQDVIAQVEDMFNVFIELQMHSFDRKIRVLDDGQAECKQSYRLKVRAGTDWRQIVEREQIRLKQTDKGWRISSGL